MNTGKKVTVLLADDNPLARTGIRKALAPIAGIEIVAEAADGEEILRLSQEISADVALIGLFMPKMDGFETIEILSKRIPCIALTARESPEVLLRAMQCGATSVLMLNTSGLIMADALFKAVEGKHYYEETAVRYMMSKKPSQNSRFTSLTPQEMDIFKLVSLGLTNDEISEKLGLNRKIVKFHVDNLLSKTKTNDRTKLAILYLNHS